MHGSLRPTPAPLPRPPTTAPQVEPPKKVPADAPRGKVEVVCVEPSLTAYSDLIRLRDTLPFTQKQQW